MIKMRLSNSTMVLLKKKSWNFKQIGQNGCVNIHEKNTFFIKNTAGGLKRARIFFITFSKKSILFITLFAFSLTINFQKRHLNTKNVIGHPGRSAKLFFFQGMRYTVFWWYLVIFKALQSAKKICKIGPNLC